MHVESESTDNNAFFRSEFNVLARSLLSCFERGLSQSIPAESIQSKRTMIGVLLQMHPCEFRTRTCLGQQVDIRKQYIITSGQC